MTDTTGFVTPPSSLRPGFEDTVQRITKHRENDDEPSKVLAHLGDRLAEHVAMSFTHVSPETVGAVMIETATSASGLATLGMQPTTVLNIIMLAGQRLITDARTAQSEADRG